MARLRALKRDTAMALAADDWRAAFKALDAGPKDLVGPLFAHLLHPDEIVAARAAEAFALVMPELFVADPAAAREVMRQMLWRMNEESGNVGWGVPEAMGAAMAGQPALADEYHRMLLSYVVEQGEICHGNFLDNARLRHGVFRGLARLALARPELVAKASEGLSRVLDPARAAEAAPDAYVAMECHDATARGLTCLALGRAGAVGAIEAVRRWKDDLGDVRLYVEDADGLGWRMTVTSVGALARGALAVLEA